MTGSDGPPCSTMPPRIHGNPAARAAARGLVVDDHGVVVHVGDGPAFMGMDPLAEDPGRDGLEVHHQVAAHQGMLDSRQQQQTRRLDRPARQHDVARARGCGARRRGR